MSKIEDGGPAFPLFADGRAATNIASLANEGMTLRDWFAGQALAGCVANPNHEIGTTFEKIGQDAYLFADAMLAARAPATDTYKQEFDG